MSGHDSRYARVAVHELGHLIGGLLDEYQENGDHWTDFFVGSHVVEGFMKAIGWGGNVTTHTNRREVPWKHWIPADVPVPTRGGGAYYPVGVYRGALHTNRYWYRPSPTCLMRDENQPFCVVCREAVVLRLSLKTRPVRVTKERLDGGKAWRFTARVSTPGHTSIKWFRNGFPMGEGPVFVTRRSGEVECHVEDENAYVRADPRGVCTFGVRIRVEGAGLFSRKLKTSRAYPMRPGEAYQLQRKRIYLR